MTDKIDLLPGTLDVIVLRTLDTLGSQHGFGIAVRIENVTRRQIRVNHGTMYAALARLQQRGWITAEWGVSDNNRRARFYSITDLGRKKLVEESRAWWKLAGIMEDMLGPQESGP